LTELKSGEGSCCASSRKRRHARALVAYAGRKGYAFHPRKQGSRPAIRMRPSKAFDEKNLHRVFEIGLVLKGIFALLEILAGIAAYFISQNFLLNLVRMVFHEELDGDPHDFIANFLIQSAQNFSVSTQLFTSFYLLAHGVIKAVLIAGLLRGKLGYYPAAIIVLCSSSCTRSTATASATPSGSC
jgi:uncharacterized membrane protein